MNESLNYKTYLLLLSQISSREKAYITIEDKTLYIDALHKKQCWRLRIKLLNKEGNTPDTIKQFLSSLGSLRWQERGAYLQYHSISHSIFLIHEVPLQECRFPPLKHHIHDFLTLSREWEQILHK